VADLTQQPAGQRLRPQWRVPQSGFGLIDLLVGAVILGILSAVVVFAAGGAGDRGRKASVAADTATLRTAEETLCAKKGHYGPPAELVSEGLLAGSPTLNSVATTGGGWCGSSNTASGFAVFPVDPSRGDGSTVKLSHAGSLAGVMANPVNPTNLGASFGVAAGYGLQATGAGSGALRDRIKSGSGAGARPDVFISADPAVTATLDLPSSPSGPNWVSWWADWARTEMVVGWSPTSPFSGAFADAKAGRRTWESVLDPASGPVPKLGRTDPDVDPKGYRTLFAFQLDEARRVAGGDAGVSGFQSRVLGAARCGLGAAPACPGGSPQIYDEATELVPRILNGQLDVGIFYTVEAVEAGIPFMTLDPAVNLGDPARRYSPDAQGNPVRYCKSTFTCALPSAYSTASLIVYSVSILQPSPAATNGPISVNQPGAEAFVRFLLDGGQAILNNQGLLPTPHRLSGSGGLVAVPESIRPLVVA